VEPIETEEIEKIYRDMFMYGFDVMCVKIQKLKPRKANKYSRRYIGIQGRYNEERHKFLVPYLKEGNK